VLFLINPHNPLGIVYREEDVRRCIRWARENGVHCVVDEIYAGSVWADEPLAAAEAAATPASQSPLALAAASVAAAPPFVSAIDICASEEGTDAIVHVLWGASKDLGMSGFRTGVLHTRNAALLEAFSNVNYFTTVSNFSQDALTQLLRDEAWLDEYMRTSRRLLRESYEALAGILRAAEIPFVEARAGMFVWIDLRRLLRGAGFAAERALTRELFEECHVLFTPGEYQHAAEPGFFRVCFGYAPKASVVVAFERLSAFAARRAGEAAAR
jgi:1-aminocyclopropane-1-carboxylate synthase